MPQTVWLLLILALLLSVGGFLLGRRSVRRRTRVNLPTQWPLMARSVLNSDERKALRVLREAMPQYIVLAKLPLVRLCQPRDGQRTEYWYDLLGPLNVSFAVCSPNGRVLAVIDLETQRNSSRRSSAIKHAVMDACRIRYLSCSPESLPSPAELQLLLPAQGSPARTVPMGVVPSFQQARSSLSDTVRNRRAERSARWADSGFPQDSFFAPDSRFDSATGDFSPSVPAPFDAQIGDQLPAEPARYRG